MASRPASIIIDFEFITVDVNRPRDQSVTATATIDQNSLPGPRAGHQAVTAFECNSSRL